jgi:O-Antigen ligase
MIGLLALGLGLSAVAVLALMLVELLLRRPEIGAGLVLGAVVLNAVMLDRVPAPAFGGMRVQVYDVVFALLLAAGTLRLLRVRRFTGFQRCLALLALLLLLSLVRGVSEFGIQRSVAESRLYLPFVSTALYFASFRPSNAMNDRIGRLWLMMSVPMMVLVCLRWLSVFAGVDVGVPMAEFGADAAVKVIDGPYTFFLACAVVLTAPYWTQRGAQARKLTLLGGVLLLFVVLLNRRTAWLALLVGVAVVVLRERRLGARTAMLATGVSLATVGLYLALPGSGPGTEPVAQSAEGTGTLQWRIQGWSGLFAGWSKDPTHWVIGQPFGTGFTRTVLGSVVQGEPHNYYFSTLLRMGFVGLLVLLALTVGLLRALWRTPTRGGGLLGPGMFPALLTMQVIWFIAWVPGLEQGIVTGLAVGLAATRLRGWQLAFPRADRWPRGGSPAGLHPAPPSGGGTTVPVGTRPVGKEHRRGGAGSRPSARGNR